ncbi:MAG: glutamate-5-semialdehyde dehydrogenase [Pseudomonadales bacterium]|nr:glutamate-5-semialdehyde dehydrogenase [Pseudomonadales bacterium]
MLEMGQRARVASRIIAAADTQVKSTALKAIAEAMLSSRAELLASNKLDLEAAAKNGLAQPLIDRLVLDDKGIEQMVAGVLQVESLGDPVGVISDMQYMPSGIQVGQMRVPLGVIGIIYESRPNVTVDAASLCLKAGNACILRGGSEAIHSNTAIAGCIKTGLLQAGLPPEVVQVIGTTDRAAVGELLKMSEYVDVLIPRGGKSLIERVSAEATMPVIKHLDGICHVYVDDDADVEMAVNIAVNSKTEKYAVCNAVETLLVAESMASSFLPLAAARYEQAGVELRACERSRTFLPNAVAASDEDWETEYLGPILAVKVVGGLAQAIDHIASYGSQHTDCIVSNDYVNTRRFITEVDSSSVLVNVSTQFADGFEYGLGAEIGISTDKLHVRGPVGLEGMTTRKYVVMGQGEVRIR